MLDALAILFSAAFVNNFVLVKFLGLCPIMGVSQRLENALGLSLATTFVLTFTSLLTYLIDHFLLIPLQLEPLRLLVFIFSIAVSVQCIELLIQSVSPLLQPLLGIFLPLITTNCIVLGVTLLNSQANHSFFMAISQAIGAGLGFSMILLLFASLREHMQKADIPQPFQGAPIAFITLGLMSLTFMGLTGIAL